MEEILKRLSAVSGVSSREDAVRETIRELAAPYADSVSTDALGNLIVFKKGAKSTGTKVLLDAHMDECGVMVSGFTDDGFLRFQLVGKVDRRIIIGKRVWMGEKELPGVIGMKPIHLSSKKERKTVPDTDDLYIDIGAKDKDDAKSKLSLGDTGHFDCGISIFGSNNWKGKNLNSKIPCAVLLALLREELPMDCTFVFGAQELVGTRGAFGAAFRIQPEIVLCLDGVRAGDGPLVKEPLRDNRLGGGVVIPVSDRTQYDRGLFELLRNTAKKEKLPWQIKAAAPQLTDAAAYQRSRRGVRVAGLAVPVRNLYAPPEVVSRKDTEHLLALTRAFLVRLAEEN